jgi:type I restriction enzyme S subunit
MRDGWERTTLEAESDFITKGTTPTTCGFDWADEGIPFLRSECVGEDGFTESGMMFIEPAAHLAFGRSRVVRDDLLITITGNVGRVARFPLPEGNINQHIARIRLRPDSRLDRPFLRQLLSTRHYRNHYELIVTGLAYPQISLAQVRETPIPVPPLDEQRRIAAILDASEATIRATEAVIEKLRSTNEGAVRVAILEATKGNVPIASLGEIVTGSTPSPSQPRYWNGQVPFITPGEIQADGVVVLSDRKLTELGCLQARMVPARSVLVVCIGSTYGKVGVFNGECATNQQINALVPAEGYHPLLIAQLVRNAFSQMSALAGLQAVPIINKSQFSRLAIPGLSVKDHESIGLLIESGIAAIAAEEAKVAKLRLQHQGLLHDLLTGTVRVLGSAA